MDCLGATRYPTALAGCWSSPRSIVEPPGNCNSVHFVAWEGEATAVNMFPTSLPKQFIAREGEAPAEPLHRWLGRSLALPNAFRGPWH